MNLTSATSQCSLSSSLSAISARCLTITRASSKRSARSLTSAHSSPLIGNPPKSASSCCNSGGCVKVASGGRKTPETTAPFTGRGGNGRGVLIERTRAPESEIASSNDGRGRSEEHTSELQSRENLVCRLLLEK